MKADIKSIIMLLVIVLAVVLGVSYFSKDKTPEDEFVYSDLIELLEDDVVVSFVIDQNNVITVKSYKYTKENGTVVFEEKDGEKVVVNYEYTFKYTTQVEEVLALAKANKAKENPILTEYNVESMPETPWYVMYLPYVLVGALIIGLWIFMMRQASQAGGAAGRPGAFAKSKAKVAVNDKNSVKFADVAGADEEKAELEEVVEFLKDPEKFIKLGARIPRGVLLVGPPGTGKTLLAKAVAGEAGVPFFSISGSDFVEMYVGVGASRVRDLFDNARKTPASIVFIDEIDAVGRRRGTGLGGGHDEREQTLNQLLVEMDGFGTNSGVIVIAATNRVDILDPALLRPGRFDRRVTVNYPDIKGREEILKVHSRNKPLEATVDLKKIAQTTIGFTGADLANLMNEAALRAAKGNKALIGMNDIEESFMKMILGPQKKTKVRTPEDNRLCAYHEAGHAVSSYFCKHTDPVKHITIIPAGNAGGVTVSRPTKDPFTSSKNEMLDEIVLCLGGRVAEEIILDDISTGASSDIQQATRTARNMVTRYGMSDKLGTVLYGSEHSQDEVFLGRDFSSGRNYSEATAAAIDDEIRNIINSCYDRCKSILTENINKLHFVAEFLLKNESMDEEQFLAAMQMENPTIESIEGILTEKKRKSEEENKTAHENQAKKEREEAARREELVKRMNNGETLTPDVLSDIFEKPIDKDSDDSDDKTNNG
jgi:cell division protease FtsH